MPAIVDDGLAYRLETVPGIHAPQAVLCRRENMTIRDLHQADHVWYGGYDLLGFLLDRIAHSGTT